MTLECFQALYPHVARFFQASDIIGQFKVASAVRNLFSVMRPDTIARFIGIGLEENISEPYCQILVELLQAHNATCLPINQVTIPLRSSADVFVTVDAASYGLGIYLESPGSHYPIFTREEAEAEEVD